ncbi:hypothetical protein GGP41_004637 [Bipolaris sorokiniana]|uniref:Uncharacterized protein n=2 Tax=Cochliobolus sativus TaxID=45130 RepID=A0A8H6DSP7_COCSA|nr:hypothetical protein GGP41_004637 [Bipolaris sorokiniana]
MLSATTLDNCIINLTRLVQWKKHAAHADDMSNKLLPPPVAIAATIGLSPATIAVMASCCTPRNLAVWLIFCNRPHLSILVSSASLFTVQCLTLGFIPPASPRSYLVPNPSHGLVPCLRYSSRFSRYFLRLSYSVK